MKHTEAIHVEDVVYPATEPVDHKQAGTVKPQGILLDIEGLIRDSYAPKAVKPGKRVTVTLTDDNFKAFVKLAKVVGKTPQELGAMIVDDFIITGTELMERMLGEAKTEAKSE